MMEGSLENAITEKIQPVYKSEGEQKIAEFLENNSIRFEYEAPLLVNSDGNKNRIWYPDFYLPEFKTYIEYYGLAGNPDYDLGIKAKQLVYSKMELDVIPVFPWMFRENWQGYIMQELRMTTFRRHNNLLKNRYWSTDLHKMYEQIRSCR